MKSLALALVLKAESLAVAWIRKLVIVKNLHINSAYQLYT